MFKLQRFYSLTSFIIIFVTAGVLTLFYRQVTVHWIDHLAKTNNQAVAQIALDSIGPELVAYLGTVTDTGKSKIVQRALPDEVAERLYRMSENAPVSDIAVYTRDGAVAFSTQAEAVSADHSSSPGFRAAIAGGVSNSMVFRDIFNSFSKTSGEDNVMQTYIPIRSDPNAPVMGVFHIHSDMNHLVEESDGIILFVLVGAELILGILYALLFFVVRHANAIIRSQQDTMQQRATSLEILSKRLLKGEELQKKQLAASLHEGLAQTLSAIKINLESSASKRTSGAHRQSLGSIVPALQHAIHEVRTIATELHPSSLDDLGLLPTVNWFCREFERQHPEIQVRREISLQEAKIPAQLKIDIYRIVESAFKNIAKYSNTDRISFVLHAADDMIHLVIGDTPTTQPENSSGNSSEPGADPQFRFAELKERASLSGGVFSTTLEKLGGVTLSASWACAK